MVSLPCIVEDFLTHGVEHLALVSVFGMFRETISILIVFEAVMRPKRIVERVISVFLGILKVLQDCSLTLHVHAELAIQFHFS